MNLLHYFVVKLPKLFNDEISMGDQTIFIETKFNEFDHRVNEGEVVHVPLKYDTPVNPGDTLYFHHNVVMNGGMPFAEYKDHYLVSYDEKVAVNCHAYAYRPKGSEEIIPLGLWSLLSPCFEEEIEESFVETVNFKTAERKTGVVAGMNTSTMNLGLNIGDVVGFKKNMDYSFKVDDKEYFRTRAEDLLYAV
tara:strand:- start:50 stop:625 length:576 start_codon:yes stop_codon:yes gene_type:complete